ncbi:MAG: S8 family serine peptidase [Candidatus Giovannonibacteria bacterium]|nr:S8 family serine peptidase [Candidatus Giovannonibacteria bacterium]
MEYMKNILTLGVVLAVSFFITGVAVAVQEEPTRVSGQILIKFKEGISPKAVEQELGKNRGKILSKIDKLGTLVVNVPRGAEDKIAEALSKNPLVEYAEPDYLASALNHPPADTYFGNQWGLENNGQDIKGSVGTIDADIDAPSAWHFSTGWNGTSTKVAILDSGIDQDHEDLSLKIVLQKNFTGSPTADDLYGHGTHVGGTVAAITNNNIGVAGGCPDCVLMNGKVLGDNGSGAYSWIANGIVWAADNGAKVINLSLGGNSPSKTLENAVNYAWSKGVVVVAAAGNCGCRGKIYPAAYKNVIAVAATNNQDKKASFSSYGAKWVDVAAPGENIFSTFPNHPYAINKSLNYDYGSGTSMATPMTAAAAALIWSTPYGTSASAVRSRLETTADKISGTGTYWSAGRVNAFSATQ